MSPVLVVACVLGSILLVAGDLGTAVRRSNHEPVVLPAVAPLTSPLVIPLSKTSARGPRGSGKYLYVGKLSMGQPPQVMSVSFDTASGMLILPHRACHNVSCMAHRRYSPWESTTAMDINANGGFIDGVTDRLAKGSHVRDVATITFTQADLGEGDVKGVFVRDGVCIGGRTGAQACVDMAVLAATSMDEQPFHSMPSDGIVGLGLQSLATSPMNSFLSRLFEGSVQVLSQFGMALDGAHGELHLGGHDTANIASPLRWFPVDHPEQGYWQVAIHSVRVGNVTVDPCLQGCHGIIDSGVSHLGVQAGRLPPLKRALQLGLTSLDHCHGEDLTFDLGGMTLVLLATDYTADDCSLQLGSMDLPEAEFTGVYALGGSLLHRYYTAFDWEQQRLGFAPLAHGAKGSSLAVELEGVLLV
jgi:hypothetical protein